MFSLLSTSTFSDVHQPRFCGRQATWPLCVDESPLTCQCEREDKKASGFQISHFYSLVPSDIMAVKELRLQPEPSGTSASQDYSQLGGDCNGW